MLTFIRVPWHSSSLILLSISAASHNPIDPVPESLLIWLLSSFIRHSIWRLELSQWAPTKVYEEMTMRLTSLNIYIISAGLIHSISYSLKGIVHPEKSKCTAQTIYLTFKFVPSLCGVFFLLFKTHKCERMSETFCQ